MLDIHVPDPDRQWDDEYMALCLAANMIANGNVRVTPTILKALMRDRQSQSNNVLRAQSATSTPQDTQREENPTWPDLHLPHQPSKLERSVAVIQRDLTGLKIQFQQMLELARDAIKLGTSRHNRRNFDQLMAQLKAFNRERKS